MRTEAQVNAIIDDGMERYYEENRRMQNGAISDIETVRREVVDVLVRHAGEDGSIDRDRIRQVLRELEVSETTYESVLNEAIDETVVRTIERAINLAVAALGAYLTVEMFPRNFRSDVRNLVINRNTGDGLSMMDRIYRLAGNTHDMIRTIVRDGIVNGSTVATISRDISRLLGANEYHVRRIVMTEGFNIYRRTLGEAAKLSGVVRAIRIIDNRGRHAHHEHHRCYILAEQNPYGWGKGVYRLEDDYIYYPHPQCTAYFRFMLVPENERAERRRT